MEKEDQFSLPSSVRIKELARNGEQMGTRRTTASTSRLNKQLLKLGEFWMGGIEAEFHLDSPDLHEIFQA